MPGYEPMDREALEESARAMRDFARMARQQYEALVESGFTEAQALRLTQTWIGSTLGGTE